jgi:hypothetical protein
MQFVYPGFLWGLLAVSVPVAIHLLQLRRPQRILFTNIGFIREVELTTTQRRRLQELLVLLARVLGVIFLVLLFAQPFIPARRAVEQSDSIGILLDASPSMQVIGEGQKPLVQEASSEAAILGKNFGATAHFRLLGQKGGVLTQAAYLSKVPEVRTSGQQRGWAHVLSQQAAMAAVQEPLYVFSDFQRNAHSKEVLQALDRRREVVLVPQVARPAANVYVDSVWLEDAFVRTQVNIGLHIRLKNGGSTAITDCPVKVRLGKQQVAAFNTTLAAGQVSTTVVQVQLPDKQLAQGQVVTEDRPAVFDNTFYFTLQPTASIRVVEIGEEPVARQAYEAEALFAYSFAKPQQVNFSQLQRANLVMVREVATFAAGLQQALLGVVRRGGSVVVVPPGGSAGREATLRLLRALGVAGAQWNTAVAGTPVLQEVAMPSPRNPFFREVFGAQPRQAVLPQVAPVLSLGRSGTDILRLRDGDSYLAEFKNGGAGRTYIFTAPFSKAYGDFTAQGLLVPVLYRMAMLSYQAGQQPAYRLTSPTVAVELTPESAGKGPEEAAFRLVRDSLTLIPSQRLRGTSLQLELPPAMGEPGFYELRRKGQLVTTLAFNADPRESELAAYSAAELQQLLGPGHPNVRVLDAAAGPEALLRYRAEQTGQALWRYCLLAVLACLLAEALLLRFGRPKAAARPMVAA